MTDVPGLTPEEEREVSRLLAEAAAPVPAPAEVVDRLDRVLADLQAERTADLDTGAAPERPTTETTETTGATVTRLGEDRHRPRRWPRALLAAAAVVAGGYGVRSALPVGSSESDSAGDSGAGSTESQVDRNAVGGSGADGAGALGRLNGVFTASGQPVLLRSERLQEDVGRLLERPRAAGGTAGEEAAAREAARGCTPSSLEPGETWYVVRFDGRRATLVVAEPQQGQVAASVRSCAGALLATASVPAP